MLKTAVQSIDFDEIERQLREAAHAAGLDRSRDEVEQVPEVLGSQRRSSGFGTMLRIGLAVALPVLVAAAGIGAVMAMRAGPMSGQADAASTKAQPALVADGAPVPSPLATGTAGRSDEVVLAPAGQPDPSVAKPAGEQVAAPEPPAAPPAPMTAVAADVPLPDPPQQPVQNSTSGTPRRVAGLSVKPEGSIMPMAGPSAAAKAKLASTDATASLNAPSPLWKGTPSARRHSDKGHPKSSQGAPAERRQASKPAMSILPTTTAENAQPPIGAPSTSGNPVTRVANGFRKVLEITHIVGPAVETDGQ
jgi:hypothetical protein